MSRFNLLLPPLLMVPAALLMRLRFLWTGCFRFPWHVPHCPVFFRHRCPCFLRQGVCLGYGYFLWPQRTDFFPQHGFVVFQAACAEVCISFAVDGAAVFQVAVPVKGEVVFGAPCAAVIDAQSFFCPTKVIRPAYMPPMAAVSRAKAGRPPFPSMAEASRVFASTVLAPVVIWRSLARCLR